MLNYDSLRKNDSNKCDGKYSHPRTDPIHKLGLSFLNLEKDNNGDGIPDYTQPCCNGKIYAPQRECCINGVIISSTETVEVKLCKRAADLPLGDELARAGMRHEFVVGPDSPAVGMGPVGTTGTPGKSHPGVLTELTDHSTEPQTDCQTYTVKRCCFLHSTHICFPTGRWIPPNNDCNSGLLKKFKTDFSIVSNLDFSGSAAWVTLMEMIRVHTLSLLGRWVA